ncbi:MAG: two-component system sensor histidine kinase CreC [Zoogloeaceae bacterium]|jgi:two-component system sensor histidine kinase CreC|nr:two-component system sensor histidine kinase CreC [Zoogloeaceae bacterium]
MNISVRFFLGFFLVVGIAAWFAFGVVSQEIEPGLRQATEETLVDASHILAELAASDLAHRRINSGNFAAALRATRRRTLEADIFGIHKKQVDFRVYITDTKGIVVFDSEGQALGGDFSRWKDVSAVLRGDYGARTTREDPDNPATSSMYVAAPILWEGKPIGALSLAKPTRSLFPYLQRATQQLEARGLWIVIVASVIGVLLCAWLTWSIHGLIRYARDVTSGRKAVPPAGGGGQFSELARALADMRERLEGKQYVEKYVQNLAHEMKSPLAAVVSAAELLESPLPEQDRHRFIALIRDEAARLQTIIERMLQLARVEQLQHPEASQVLHLGELAREALAERVPQLEKRGLRVETRMDDSPRTTRHADNPPAPITRIRGDAFLLRQAIGNLIDNAIDFSPEGGLIRIEVFTRATPGPCHVLRVRDQGAGAPDYALPQLFDRFYSLPRPATGRKSTGLGLPFVREVARLHGGDARFSNHPEGGAEVRMEIPVAWKRHADKGRPR